MAEHNHDPTKTPTKPCKACWEEFRYDLDNGRLKQPTLIFSREDYMDVVRWINEGRPAVPTFTIDPCCPYCEHDVAYDATDVVRAQGEEPEDILKGMLVCNGCNRVIGTASSYRMPTFSFPDVSEV
jgi:hypothetical protein